MGCFPAAQKMILGGHPEKVELMRLSDRQRQTIRQATRRFFGADSTVHLFGSRLRDDLRGGDIDLYVEGNLDAAALVEARLFLAELHATNCLEGEKIDVALLAALGTATRNRPDCPPGWSRVMSGDHRLKMRATLNECLLHAEILQQDIDELGDTTQLPSSSLRSSFHGKVAGPGRQPGGFLYWPKESHQRKCL
jgi:predicted nucleotidyltransferase